MVVVLDGDNKLVNPVAYFNHQKSLWIVLSWLLNIANVTTNNSFTVWTRAHVNNILQSLLYGCLSVCLLAIIHISTSFLLL